MTTKAKPIPDGFEGATPYLSCRNAATALDFYKKAFGAEELLRMADPSGKVMHAEIRISKAVVMLADEFPEMGFVSPEGLGGSPLNILIYVEDVDSFVSKAVAAGAILQGTVETHFYGDRSGRLHDPFGHRWMISTHVEDVPPEELSRRAAALFAPK